ncbi:MAG: 50S ribosomal protein L32e [Methanoregula sp.]|nr:50S ribosomal protein L32e [Methanoregula sp.]
MATEVKRLIKVRVEKGASFKRDGYGKKRQLSDSWRKPRGQHNKQREQKKAKGALPKPGFGSPIAVRGMHPSGFFETLVSSEKDLEGVNPATHAVRISGTVGDRKRAGLQEKAIGAGLKVLNAKVVKAPAAAEKPAEPKEEAKPKKEERRSVKAKISAAISPKKEKAAAGEEKKAPVKKAAKAKPAEAPAKKSAKKPAAEAKEAKPKAAAKPKTAKKSDSGVKKNE